MVDQHDLCAVASDNLTALQAISDAGPLGLTWSPAPVREGVPTSTSVPAAGLALTVRADGFAHLQGEAAAAAILPSVHQQAVILHQLLNGRVVLHGSAVVVDGAAVATIGPSGAGKSTTAAALVQRGAELLADDVVAIDMCDGRCTVLPTESHLRLAAAGRSDGPGRKVATRPGGHLTPATQVAGATRTSLAVVLVLTQDDSATQPQWSRLHGLAALDALREFGAGPRGLDILGPARLLQGLARIADGVQVWRLMRSVDEPPPEAIADKLWQIVQELPSSPAAAPQSRADDRYGPPAG